MIQCHEPRWQRTDLVPGRLWAGPGFSRTSAEVQRLGTAAAAGWADRLARPQTAGDAWVLIGGAGVLAARIAARLLDDARDELVVVVSRHPRALFGAWAEFLPAGCLRRLVAHHRLRLVAADATAEILDWTGAVPRAAVVMHLAAEMSALAGWRRLAPANLHSLRAAVALARRDGALLQLASTLSLFVSSNGGGSDRAEALPVENDRWLHGGYAQTKAAAEAALAGIDGIDWQIVRYGLLVPEAGGRFPPGHFAPSFGAAITRIGSVPDVAEAAEVDLTPVDHAARLSVDLADRGKPGFAHVAGPQPATLAEVVRQLEPLPAIPRAAWLAAVDALPAISRALLRSAFAKSLFLAEDAARGPVLNMDLFQATGRRFGATGVPPAAAVLPGLAGALAG